MSENLKQVLKKASNQELTELLKLFEKQWTSSVLEIPELKGKQQREEIIDLLEKEIREFGGNTFANMFRGGGPEYSEIVCDVASKFKVNTNGLSIPEIEDKICCVILQKAIDHMSEDERREIFKTLSIDSPSSLKGEALIAALMAIFRAGGFKSYQLTLIIVHAVWKYIFKQGLSFAGSAALTKTLSILTGPVGWAITAIWTAIDIAGPAYRVTIPSVLYIAMLRKK
ncbi:MAG: hypothetical protein K6G44_05185 [Lentisphaeria bacterium]|nr:hypothetical protein [Lentisphaeria bacterium]